MRIIEVNPQTDRRWEAFAAAHRDGLVYHHPRWLRAIDQAYGHQALGLACEDASGQLRGILPLSHTRGVLAGRRLVSLPHTLVAGPLTLDGEATAALIRAAVERVRAEPGTQLQIKAPLAGLDGLVEGLVGVPWKATYRLELPNHIEKLRFGNSRQHGRIKWAVAKASRLGVRVRPAETEGELRAWYKLYLDTMRYHAAPPHPYRFFKICWELLQPQGLMRLLLAEQHGAGRDRLLAGSIFLRFGQTVFYAFNGRWRDELLLRPNDIIQWQAIHDAWTEGFRRYDFGQVAERHDGLAKFKSKWGAEPSRLHRYYYPVPRELESGFLTPGSRTRRFADAVWRRLPLHATAILGGWIDGHL
jgi:CelD/BcsL family acetyltransferase involved in cellulose biosynthesis